MGGEEPLLISVSSLPGDLFTDKALVVTCSLGKMNEIKTTSLLDTGTTDIAFIDLTMARQVCDVLQISFIQLAKPKPIREFDGKLASPITHAIYPMLTVQGHTELLVPFLIIKLGQHPLILGKPWMQKYSIILDISYDKLIFWPGHCQHLDFLPAAVNTLVELHLSTNAHLRISATMLLVPLVENPTTGMTASAKPQKLKSIKILLAIPGVRPAYWSVSKLADSKREKYVVLAKHILKLAMISKPKAELVDETKPLDLAFICAALFQYLAKQKDVEIFAVSMWDIENELNAILIKNIEYQLNKMAKTLTDPKTVILKEYHKFLDVFSKEALDTLLPHSKYDYQIHLLKEYRKHGHSLLSKMSELKL